MQCFFLFVFFVVVFCCCCCFCFFFVFFFLFCFFLFFVVVVVFCFFLLFLFLFFLFCFFHADNEGGGLPLKERICSPFFIPLKKGAKTILIEFSPLKAYQFPFSFLNFPVIRSVSIDSCNYPNYWDTLTPYHTCPKLCAGPFFYLLICLKMLDEW